MKSITQKVSFGVMASFAVLAALMLPFTSFAATTWQATAPASIVFSCLGNGSLFPHTLNTVNQSGTGVLSGTGTYDSDTGYTWNLAGQVTDNTVTFAITYAGKESGSVYSQIGTIAADGSVSGASSSNCQSFTMPAGSFIHPLPPPPTSPTIKDECKKGGWEDFGFKNQGQCVRYIETGKDSR